MKRGTSSPFLFYPSFHTKFILVFQTITLIGVLWLSGGSARAGNLLSNPSFETAPSGQVVPAGWTYYAPPTLSSSVHDYWVANQTTGNNMAAHTGTFFWKQWTAQYGSTNNVAGIYQMFGSAPGAVYQASGWLGSSSNDAGGLGLGCKTWMQVEFLDSSSNLLALYKSPSFDQTMGLSTWVPFSVTNACDLRTPVPTGDPYFTTYDVTGTVSQIVAPARTASVLFRYAYLAVGTNEVGSAVLDDAVLNQISGSFPPVISSLFPADTMIFVNPSSGVSFQVNSPSGYTINTNGIHMTVNNVDVSSSLAISGTASNKTVSYSGLQSNTAYTVSISVTDVSNLTANASAKFQTMWLGVAAPTYVWEAEDWDFTNGMFINFPDLCNASGDPNCYFGKTGTQGTDEHNTSGASGAYRPSDMMGSVAAGDNLRPSLFYSNRIDYCINPFNGGEWINYTRNWPNSTNWVIARLATDIGLSGNIILSVVNPDLSTTELGTFSINSGQGWTAFQNVYLIDTNNNKAVVYLNGKQTLRATSGGNLLPNFFMLIPAQADLPLLSNVYPTGTHPFEYTNTFSFTVTATGSSFPPNGINVKIDGNDVTSSLQISGSTSSKNVVYPTLMPNAIHTAIISVTNSLGHGILVTNHFDTFSESNFMVETEDFDYNGGQFFDPWTPDVYAGSAGTTNIDFQHITLPGEQFFNYRPTGIPQDIAHDYLRQVFVNAFGTDYTLTYFGNTDWVNYTRNYPAGSFYVYGRASGGSGITFTMYLDQVVSGAGTTSQTTKRLGQWTALGRDYQIFDWVPLTDSAGGPVVVKLNGLSTLRLTTTGYSNPSFFMLVPAIGISVGAARSGGNIVLSFPTQAGVTYRVLYRTDLNSGSWTQLSSVVGDGTVKTVSDPTTAARRFYKVVAP